MSIVLAYDSRIEGLKSTCKTTRKAPLFIVGILNMQAANLAVPHGWFLHLQFSVFEKGLFFLGNTILITFFLKLTLLCKLRTH